jgi:hypothetical protein
VKISPARVPMNGIGAYFDLIAPIRYLREGPGNRYLNQLETSFLQVYISCSKFICRDNLLTPDIAAFTKKRYFCHQLVFLPLLNELCNTHDKAYHIIRVDKNKIYPHNNTTNGGYAARHDDIFAFDSQHLYLSLYFVVAAAK